MKTKTLCKLLALFAVICAVIAALPGVVGSVFGGIMAFPLEPIAIGLRALSLSGDGGNIAAIVIYAVVCLIPAAAMLLHNRKRGFKGEDALIYILSAAMFVAVYFMINPALIFGGMGGSAPSVLRAALGGVCWCVLISWVVLKILRRSELAQRENLQTLLRGSLIALSFVFVAAAFGGGVGGFISSVKSLRAGNTGDMVSLTPSYVFLALQSVVSSLPYVLDAIISVKGAETLAAMNAQRYGEEAAAKAEALAAFAAKSLRITVVLSLALNLLQLVSIRQLLVVDISVSLPLVSLAFMLGAALLSRFVRENKTLKDDNDLFI